MSQVPSSVWTRSTKANDRPSASRKPRPAVSTTIKVIPGLVISQKSASRAETGRDGSSSLSGFESASMETRGEPAAKGEYAGGSLARTEGDCTSSIAVQDSPHVPSAMQNPHDLEGPLFWT